MKLRVLTKDFIVDEISELKLEKSGNFSIYLLKKEGLETFALIEMLSKANNIPKRDFGYAGIKDRHGITTQAISIPSKYKLRVSKGKGFSLEHKGYSNTPIQTGNLIGNRFKLTIRDLENKDIEKIKSLFNTVKQYGVPNYFDSQRFGSMSNGVFIGKLLMKEDYMGAIRTFLMTQYEEGKKSPPRIDFKNEEEFLRLNLDVKYLKYLQRELEVTKSWRSTYKRIPIKLRELFLMSYQSYLWNETVKMLLEKRLGRRDLEIVGYKAGSLLFLGKNIPKDAYSLLPKGVQTIGRQFKTDAPDSPIIEELLNREGITFDEVKAVSKSGSFLKSYQRELFLRPNNIHMSDIRNDDIYKGKKLIELSFELPKGAYATVIVKGLFLR